jgi:hypothetical protein
MATSKTTVAVPPPSAAQVSDDYAGSDTCIICHADQGEHFKKTVMGKAFAHPKNAKEKLGCESCHGPGKAHVEAGGGKETIPIRFAKDSKKLGRPKKRRLPFLPRAGPAIVLGRKPA